MSFFKIALNGVKWTAFSSVVGSIVKLLQVAILTRFLTKEDFGTIAIAILFIGFTSIFLDMGLSTAIMHKQNISKKEYSSLFWLNIISGTVLTILLALSAPLIASYYDDEALIPIIQLLSLNIFFSSVGRQSRTIRHKKLNFKLMSNVENITSVLTLLIVVFLAVNDFGVYSLVYSTMFNIAFSNSIYLVYALKIDKNIMLHYKFSETYAYLKIGVYQLGSGVLDYFSRELDVFIISSAFGRETLGAYSLCKRIGIMLFSIITPIVLKVTTPLFAKMQNSKNKMTTSFLQLFKFTALFNIPIFSLVALLAPLLLNVLYGASYVEHNLILSFSVFIYALSSVNVLVSSVQIALGRTDLGFYWTIYRIISTSIFLFVGVFFTPEILTLILLIGIVINLYPFWKIQIKPQLNISFKEYATKLLVPFGISVILVFGIRYVIGVSVNIGVMILSSIVYLMMYMALTFLLNPTLLKEIKLFTEKIKNK